MNVKYILLEKFKDGSFALLTDEEIARKLRLGRRDALGLYNMLRALVREGELLSDSRRRYGTAEQFRAKKGVFTGNERGFGFVMPEDGSGELFIPHRATCGALHGDLVLAIPVKGRSGDEGEVLAVISRGLRELVGTYRAEGKIGYLVPDERKFASEVLVPRAKSLGAKSGEKAVVKITSYHGHAPEGEIIEVLGSGGDFFTEELALIRAHHLREEFPQAVLDEAERAAARGILETDLIGREDLRGELIITVDGEDTRDIDDAISVSENGDGSFSLGVHIADVSHYVKRRSACDSEAYRRGTSVYFPDRVLPMLPKALSNGICSLNEGEDRLTLSCFMQIDGRGKVLKKRIAPTVIKSRHRMTYTAVTAIAESDRDACRKYPDLVPFVRAAVKLTNILKKAREKRGGVELDIKEAKILYEDGKISIPDYARTVSHEMIEQFMVLANESVAELMTAKKAPFVYRIHERPSEDKANEFLTFLREAGIAAQFTPTSVAPQDYQKLLRSLEGKPLYAIVNRVMLRSMMKAKYSPENVGHFGLASDCYCHFTSPIRRYPDLTIHRIIKDMLVEPARAKAEHAPFVEEAAVQSSLSEKNAAEAEREVDALYITAYMQEHIGEEYEAVISGVTAFGLFAELKNTVEGLIPVETLPDDFYTFDEERFTLHGTRNVFRLGERVRVQVAGVDWGLRRTQFALLEKLS